MYKFLPNTPSSAAPETFSPYRSLNDYLRETFGEKIYKLALDGGMSCPNRDGTAGTGGCSFCSLGGSGDFAEPLHASVTEQIEAAKQRVKGKMKGGRYIAYFQSYTNTYAPVDYLEALFTEAVSHPDIAALSVATRPDCLPDETVALLGRLNTVKPVWVELGLQTIHEDTAAAVGRGYPLSCFTDAVRRLKAAGLAVVVHVILGLPGEDRERMLETVKFLAGFMPRIDGIKLQLLHVLKGTRLAGLYEEKPFPVMSRGEYIELLICCIRLLPPDIVIHRLSGDGPKHLLIAPLWTRDKKAFLGAFQKALRESGAFQGEWFGGSTAPPSI